MNIYYFLLFFKKLIKMTLCANPHLNNNSTEFYFHYEIIKF